ncbi:MAG: hypothetical protein ACJA0G_000969 [Kangiellaceae bacterium]|jgi:hypothetical protein
MAMTLISYHNLISNITTVLPKATQVLCNRLTTILLLIAFLSACNMTSTPASTITVDTSIITVERMSTQCITQVQTQQNAMNAPSLSQSVSLANAAQHCVSDIQYSPKHPDIKTAMQFSALAFVNYVKAGDMQAAANSLAKFTTAFPQQDLLFADYTSFVDTATVLIKQSEVSPYQLTSLNINQTLRAEITRQRKWSLR